jgi:hypothetical protein
MPDLGYEDGISVPSILTLTICPSVFQLPKSNPMTIFERVGMLDTNGQYQSVGDYHIHEVHDE